MSKGKVLTQIQKQVGEITHVKWDAALYRRIKAAADAEHRSITNFIQVAVIEALERRNGK